MSRLRVQTPSRLHFGLFGWGSNVRRQFGGVGLMIQEPGLEIVVEPATHWETIGPLADRTLEIASEVARQLELDGFPVRPLRLETLHVPAAHVGLGVGTQLSLAVARALTELAGLPQTPVETLARLTRRGLRSGIGIHGFAQGGLILDAGRRGEDDLPTRLVRLSFPQSWSILIVLPDQRQGLHGAEERDAFRTLTPMPEGLSDRLCRLVLLGLLPGVIEVDLNAFGASLSEIQQIVGSTFAPAQGGRFRHPEVEALADGLIRLGLQGVGQSSWGPTLYGFSDGSPADRDRLRQTLLQRFQLRPELVFWTRASDTGATLLE